MTNKRCPECQKQGHDNGSDDGHLFLMSGGDRWCCNHTHYHESSTYYFASCDPDGNPVHDRVGEAGEANVSKKQPEEPVVEQGDKEHTSSPFESKGSPRVSKGPCVDFRSIPKDIYDLYGCKMKTNKQGEVSQVYYPIYDNSGEQIGWKERGVADKTFYAVEL